MSGAAILIVDDDFAIRRLLRTTLERAGYTAMEADNARATLAAVADLRPAAVLLDLGLPDRDGLELVPILKQGSGQQAGPAVIVVSARETTDDKVAALDLGADDYVSKPFDSEELLARLRAALRHRLADQGAAAVVTVGELTLDLVHRRVTRGGEGVHLTRKEYAVLAALAAAPGRVVLHQAILAAAWPDEAHPAIEYLRLVVRNLRQKIEPDPAHPTYVVNELGVGYRLLGE